MKHIFLITLFISMFLLCSCDGENNIVPNREDLGLYSCTEEQMNRVYKESDYCSKNTGIFSSYCYRSAIQRNCVFTGKAVK